MAKTPAISVTAPLLGLGLSATLPLMWIVWLQRHKLREIPVLVGLPFRRQTLPQLRISFTTPQTPDGKLCPHNQDQRRKFGGGFSADSKFLPLLRTFLFPKKVEYFLIESPARALW